MRSRLNVAALDTRGAPCVKCNTHALTPHNGNVVPTLVPMRMASLRYIDGAIRHLSSNPIMLGNLIGGKLHSFMLAAKPLHLALSVHKHGGGYDPMRRTIFVEAGIENDHGEITIRVNSGVVSIMSGPVRVLSQEEALALFGPVIVRNQGKVYDHAKEANLLGIGLTGQNMTPSVRVLRALDEQGEEHQLTVKRRRRAVQI